MSGEDNFAEDWEGELFSRRLSTDQSNFHIDNSAMNQPNDNNGHTHNEAPPVNAPIDKINIEAPINDKSSSQPTANGGGAPKPKKMSKGAIKRFKALIEKGVPEDEARQKALIIPPQQVSQKKAPGVVKRLEKPRNENRRRLLDNRFSTSSTNQSFVRSTIRPLMNSIPAFVSYPLPGVRARYGEEPIVFRRRYQESPIKMDPKQIRVYILPINYPIGLLSNERMKMIEEQILSKITLQKYSHVKPAFISANHRIGYIHLICKDRATVHWLKNLYNWAVEDLQVVDSYELPLTNVMEACFPFSAELPTSAVFDLVSGQNTGLFTDKWKIISEVVSGLALHLIIAMDERSLETLEREKFKFNYRFSSVKVEHCAGSENDIILSHKKFTELNSLNASQFRGRESYVSEPNNDYQRENIFNSDFHYNRP